MHVRKRNVERLGEQFVFAFYKDGNLIVSKFYGYKHLPNPIQVIIRSLDDPFKESNVWIAKEQINELNCKDVRGDGTISYDFDTKTLLLSDATIEGSGPATGTVTERGVGIYSEEPGLTINVQGTNTISGDTDNQALWFYGKCNPLITGDGTLKLNSNIEALYDSGTLDTLTIGGEVTVEADGGIAGMYRFRATNQIWYNSLRIKDNATVKAYRDSSSGLYHWDNLILEDDHAITTPQGAYWDANKHLPVNADGSDITGGWVTIEKAKTYDQVYVASITADTITIDMKTATPEQIQLFIGINALSIVEELQIEDKSKTEANFLNKNGKLLLQGLTIDETTAQFILA
ncbi:MAG: hypothetical protein IJV52_00780, partial [Prevotella sp.]|nr:hypothetical protein [Prevotella sp.]